METQYILCIDMILIKFQFYVVYIASSSFDYATLQSNITQDIQSNITWDIMAQFVSWVATFETLTIIWKESKSIWE